MTTAIQKHDEQLDSATLLKLATGGDASALNDAQRLAYYRARCEAAGLDPRAHPFEFTKLDGKLVLYARKAATDGLTAQHGVSLDIVSQVTEGDLRIVTVQAKDKSGRTNVDVGVVSIGGAKGQFLANAYMKAVTKAKRRTILSMYGLGMLDETEVEEIHAQERKGSQEAQGPRARAIAARVVEVAPPAAAMDALGAKAQAIVDEVSGEAAAGESAIPPVPREPPPLTRDDRRRELWARMKALGWPASKAQAFVRDIVPETGPDGWTEAHFHRLEARLAILEDEKSEAQE